MADHKQEPDSFCTLDKVLLRCWIFGFVLLLVWFGAFRLADEFVYRVNGELFGLSKHELDVISYCGMGLVKLLLLLFFFFPWLAIRLVLRGVPRSQASSNVPYLRTLTV